MSALTKPMTEYGVGPRFAVYTALYCLVMVALTRYFDPRLTITLVPYSTLATAGTILVLLGIPFYLLSVLTVIRAFKARRLVVTGTFSMCRHPVYSAWIVFFVPGIALLLSSWPLLSAPFVMYLVAVALVKEEEAYLEVTFGKEFQAYRKKVPAIVPYGWLRKNT